MTSHNLRDNLQAFSSFCPNSTVKILLLKRFKSSKNLFCKFRKTKNACKLFLNQQEIAHRRFVYIVQNSIEKFYRVGVQVHFSPENICGLRILFSARFMPTNRFVQPFVGIKSFLSTLVGGVEGN